MSSATWAEVFEARVARHLDSTPGVNTRSSRGDAVLVEVVRIFEEVQSEIERELNDATSDVREQLRKEQVRVQTVEKQLAAAQEALRNFHKAQSDGSSIRRAIPLLQLAVATLTLISSFVVNGGSTHTVYLHDLPGACQTLQELVDGEAAMTEASQQESLDGPEPGSVQDNLEEPDFELSDWERFHFSPEEANDWGAYGFHAQSATPWRYEFAPNEAAEWRDRGFTYEHANEWREQLEQPKEASDWVAAGFTPEVGTAWAEYGFGPDDATEWRLHTWLSPSEAEEWFDNECAADEAQSWITEDFTVEEAIEWRDKNFDADSAARQIKRYRDALDDSGKPSN